jgi:hypothetical protein
MVKKLEKDEIYERWGKQLEATKDFPFASTDKYRNLIVLLQTCEILISDIKARKVKKYDQIQLISRFLMSHVYQLGSSTFELVKTGFGNPALILCRSMLESLIDMAYLYLCKEIHKSDAGKGDDKERDAWLEYYKTTRYSVYSHWEAYVKHRESKGLTPPVEEFFDEELVQILKDGFQDFQREYPFSKGGRNWAKIGSLVLRARAVDDTGWLQKGFPSKDIIGFENLSLEEEYIVPYKHTSEHAHGESGSLHSLMDSEGNIRTIIVGPSDSNIVTAIGMAANYLLVFTYLFAHINNLDLHFILKELERHGFTAPAKE